MAQAQRNNTTDLPIYQEYAALRDYLMQRVGYTKQSTITAATGLSGVRTRAVCNAYPCLAIGTTEGYKLARYASRDEIQHATATLMNRSLKMLTRAQALSGLLAR